MNTIEVKNLIKTYQTHRKAPGLAGSIKSFVRREYIDVEAVKEISFNLERGELVGFIGPNGAGKTTTLKVLSGLLYPTSGKVDILGYTPWTRKSKYLRQISLVMGQKNQLWWDLPSQESFTLNKEIYSVPDDQYQKTLGTLLEMLEFQKLTDIPVRKLSLGQRMKAELIAALLHSPKILFLDEPTIGLDVVVQKNLRQFIKEYNAEFQSTILLTSHYMGDVEELCQRVIVIDEGQIGYDGRLQELVKKYAPNKTITLIFLEEITRDLLEPYGKITSYDPLRVTFEVPRNQTREIASRVLQELPVDDLDIAEMPIEEIIRQVFGASSKE